MSDFRAPFRAPSSGVGTFDPDEVERRAGIEPLHALLGDRQRLVAQLAPLWSVYGPFGTWDHQRKSELSRLKSLIRLQAMKDSVKLNNDQVDEQAHEHPDYAEFVVRGTKERAEFFRLTAQVEAIDFRINRGQGLLRYVTSEPRI